MSLELRASDVDSNGFRAACQKEIKKLRGLTPKRFVDTLGLKREKTK